MLVAAVRESTSEIENWRCVQRFFSSRRTTTAVAAMRSKWRKMSRTAPLTFVTPKDLHRSGLTMSRKGIGDVTEEDAVTELMKNSGSQFDPAIVNIFIEMFYKNIKEDIQ